MTTEEKRKAIHQAQKKIRRRAEYGMPYADPASALRRLVKRALEKVS